MIKSLPDTAVIRDTYYSTGSLQKTALILGVSPTCIQKRLKKANIPMLSKGRAGAANPLNSEYTFDDVLDQCGSMSFLHPTVSGKVFNTQKQGVWFFRCKCGRVFSPRLGNVLNGNTTSCGCTSGRISSEQKIVQLQARAIKNGGRLLSQGYTGKNSKYMWECKYGHQWSAPWSRIQSGSWCKRCATSLVKLGKEASNRNRGEFLIELADRFNGKCLSTGWVNSKDLAEWECSSGHKFQSRPNDVQQGHWCPKCGHRTSKTQLEIAEYVKSIIQDSVVINDTNTIKSPKGRSLELDIFIPSRMVAIEFNGLIWHSSWSSKNKANTHLNKAMACRAAGVSLLAVFEDEWKNKQELIKAMIRHRLGIYHRKIRASKLQVVHFSKNKDFSWFFERNHIDGHARGKFAIGLLHDNQLVSCMSFRVNFNGEMEICRFASDYDFHVYGAASKLLGEFRKLHTNPLVTFSNNRIGKGDVYLKLGFQLIQENNPSYWYTDGYSRIWRFKCKRNNSPEILSKYPTEREQALAGIFSNGKPMYRIYDYGHRKWLLP